ncbi:MAG: hypothetical protein ACTHJT_16770 [Cytophaga sp.]|uniref:hypothetical protein n=1 Tax=Cytophaga sp. TaxID=29535 RepID=UPI003F80674F
MKKIFLGILVCWTLQSEAAVGLEKVPSPVPSKSIICKDTVRNDFTPVLLNRDPYTESAIEGKSPADKRTRQERRRQTIRIVSKTTEDVLFILIEVAVEVLECWSTYQ